MATDTDDPITHEEWLALHMIRAGKEPSRAMPQEFYRDPQTREVSMLRTKEAEKLMEVPLDNWLRWGRRKDWMPVGFRCPLGFLYQSTDVHDTERNNKPPPINEPAASRLEAIIKNLPERHRKAFVMYELGKAADMGMIVLVTNRDHACRLLGVRKTQYHDMVRQAFNMIYTRW